MIWKLLGESWPLVSPRARLRDAIGEEGVASLERSGAARASPLTPGDGYPCRCAAADGCTMRLVDEGGLIAVCELAPAQCADERLAEDDAVRLHVDDTSLVPLLQRALRVPVRPVDRVRGVYPLGERRVGSVEARFVLAPRPTRWVADGWLDRSMDEDPDRALVVLVFDPTAIPGGAPRKVRGQRVEWVALSEAFSLDGRTLDLAGFWLAVAPGADLGSELWPRYTFIADPERGRFLYAGRPLPLDNSALTARLLVELLREAGTRVPRNRLLVALWPDDFGRGKRPDLLALDRRLRQLKSQLSAAFLALPTMKGVEPDPIRNHRAPLDTDGGYSVAVAAERVLWASQPE